MRKLLAIACLLSLFTNLNAQEQTADVSNTSTLNDNLYRAFVDRLKNDDRLLHIKLDTRFDFNSEFDKNDVNELSFRGQTLKLWIVGEIAPGIRYRLRHRLNKTQTGAQRENYGPATDQAFMDFDAGKHFTFRVGKQSVQFGTYEYDINPADVYLPSMCFDDLDAYKAGINIAYKTAGQVFNLQVINSDAPQFAKESFKRKALAGLFLWEGSLFNNTLNTRWGYGLFQHSSREFNHWATIGTQLKLNKFSAEFDWYWGKRMMDMQDAVGIEEATPFLTKVKDQSFALNLSYKFGKFVPMIKGIWNKRSDNETDDAYRNLGVQAVVEFYPFKEGLAKNLRFHAMYAHGRTSFDGAFDGPMQSYSKNTIMIGTRWLFNVW